MLQEKTMVNDVLSMTQSNLAFYATTIAECENPSLRSALQQMRNSCEASRFELYHIAQTKGYYQPAAMASDTEVQQVRTQLQG